MPSIARERERSRSGANARGKGKIQQAHQSAMPVPPPSNETQSAWPSSEAICSGVHGTPRTGARAVASAPAQRRRPTMAAWPCAAATWSGADPSSFGWLTEAAPAGRDQQQLAALDAAVLARGVQRRLPRVVGGRRRGAGGEEEVGGRGEAGEAREVERRVALPHRQVDRRAAAQAELDALLVATHRADRQRRHRVRARRDLGDAVHVDARLQQLRHLGRIARGGGGDEQRLVAERRRPTAHHVT